MKLSPVYLGVSKEGLLRVDVKTKEVRFVKITTLIIHANGSLSGA